MTTAGPFPTKTMFEALKREVRPESPWAYQDHFNRAVADATTEGFTSDWPGALSIDAGTGAVGHLGALSITTPPGEAGNLQVNAGFPQVFPPLGEFEVRLALIETAPALEADIQFLLLGKAEDGSDLMVTFNCTNAWTSSDGSAWATPIPLYTWETVRVRLTPEGVTFTRSDGAVVTAPLPPDWELGASGWALTVRVSAAAVAGEQAFGLVDVLAWRPLPTGSL